MEFKDNKFNRSPSESSTTSFNSKGSNSSTSQQYQKSDSSSSTKRGYNHYRSRFNWPDQLHQKFITAIFDVGLAVANTYAIDETVTAIVEDADISCDADEIKSYLQDMNEFRQRVRLRDENWVKLLPQRISVVSDPDSELGKRLMQEAFNETRERNDSMVGIVSKRGNLKEESGPYFTPKALLTIDRQTSTINPQKTVLHSVGTGEIVLPFSGENNAMTASSSSISMGGGMGEGRMELANGDDFADFLFEPDADIDGIRSFLTACGLLQPSEEMESSGGGGLPMGDEFGNYEDLFPLQQS